jgi:hypothetical protein
MPEITDAELEQYDDRAQQLVLDVKRLIAEVRRLRLGHRWNEVGPEVAEALRGLVYAWEQDEGCICVANTDDDPCAYCTAVAAIAKAEEISDG